MHFTAIRLKHGGSELINKFPPLLMKNPRDFHHRDFSLFDVQLGLPDRYDFAIMEASEKEDLCACAQGSD